MLDSEEIVLDQQHVSKTAHSE